MYWKFAELQPEVYVPLQHQTEVSMSEKPTKLIAALEKYLDPKVPHEKQGLPMHGRPDTTIFMAAGNRGDPVDIQLNKVDGGFKVAVVLGGGTVCYHGSPVFIDTDESAQQMLDWIRSR
jgi:hypothetical protein